MITEIKRQITQIIVIISVLSVGIAFAAKDYTWKVTDTQHETKIGKTYKGINEGLNWVKEVFACPGGWNGSADYQRFNNTGLQRYRVNKNGDLVFPDDTVWYKSEGYAKAHPAVGAWKKAPHKSNIDDCADNDAQQYEYAQNLPSALAIADAWDGVKNLISGPSGTHKKENGYYADNAKSWHRDIGNGQGKSRITTIEEYQKARGDEASLIDSLLYGTGNYPRYQWSGDQGDATYGYGSRTYSAEKGVEGGELVTYPFAGCWVVEK